MKYLRCFLIIYLLVRNVHGDNWVDLNLPENHLKYYFQAFPSLTEKCQKDYKCPYKDYLYSDSCWGYEAPCEMQNAFSIPECPGDHRGWVTSKKAQLDTFYHQGDFGYIRDQQREMMIICKPNNSVLDSFLNCTQHLRFCVGNNIVVNFTRLLQYYEPIRYKMDVLKKGDIKGHCSLDEKKLLQNSDHLSPLQSWGPEIRNFKESSTILFTNDCDIYVNKPTYVLKIDAAVNMYHHFCDFFNLYASMHVNSTHASMFSTDNHIIIWESHNYRSAFQDTFEAFTQNSLWNLNTFRGKSVCFRNIVFPLLPRMIFGLYYNTPLIYGCEKSGLFKAFSEFILHRLKIPVIRRESSEKLQITLLSRDTQYRKILNEDDLVQVLQTIPGFIVKKVNYNRFIPFKKQLEITRNTDIFIGIHGAGLTHFLFLPDWAVGFELYNCGDVNCYKDLARLRGIRYITWKNEDKVFPQDPGTHPHGSAHAKFINYTFDVNEFKRLVLLAAKYVQNHKKFKEMFKKQYIHNYAHKNKEEL